MFAPVCSRSLKTACLHGRRLGERTGAHPSERRTLPFLPRTAAGRAASSAPGVLTGPSTIGTKFKSDFTGFRSNLSVLDRAQLHAAAKQTPACAELNSSGIARRTVPSQQQAVEVPQRGGADLGRPPTVGLLYFDVRRSRLGSLGRTAVVRQARRTRP